MTGPLRHVSPLLAGRAAPCGCQLLKAVGFLSVTAVRSRTSATVAPTAFEAKSRKFEQERLSASPSTAVYLQTLAWAPAMTRPEQQSRRQLLSMHSKRRGAELASSMARRLPTIFLVDVDNTLIDNDGIQQDLKEHLERAYGAASRIRYWKILEDLFDRLGYRDYLGALQRYRAEHPLQVELLAMSSFLIDYPFADR